MSSRPNRLSRVRALLPVMGIAVFLTGSCVFAREDPLTQEAVIDTLHEACRAYERGDTEAMSRLLTEDFTLTNSTGVVTTRADDIEAALKGLVTYEIFENRDMKARLYGNAAIVTGRTVLKGTSGNDTFDAEFQFTDTLVVQDGRWKVASSHVSLLKSNLEQGPIQPER